MSAFQMTCSCGDTMNVDAGDRNEAIEQLKAMMNEDAIAAHMRERHPGDPVPPVAEVHKMIEAATVPA